MTAPVLLPNEPVYDYRPLTGDTGETRGIRAPRPADPLVFGIPLERAEVWLGDTAITGRCRPCGVRWAWTVEACLCWNCEGAAC